MKKGLVWFTVILVLLLGLGLFVAIRFYYVFSDGTKTGELNSLTYTGYFFKTYEGEMILIGYGAKNATGVQSKTFKFSVGNKEVAEKMRQCTGEKVTVHYKEYFGALPWRGYQKAIVDSLIVESPALDSNNQLFL